MRLITALLSVVLLFGRGVSAQTPGLGGPTLWLSDRSVGEGMGIRTGDFEWHPGVATEAGFDSNFFQRSSSGLERTQFGDATGAFRLRVLPHLSLRTLDRRLDERGRAAHRALAFEAGGHLSYNELVGFAGAGPEYEEARNLQGGFGIGLTVLPDQKWSANLQAGYTYVYDPTNQGGFTSDFSRHLVDARAGLLWKPGGGAFEWTLLQYRTRLSLFDKANFTIYNNQSHQLASAGKWRFLPKTALLFDGSFGAVQYPTFSSLNDGTFLSARLGLSGLVWTRVGLMAMLGWASSFYVNGSGLAGNYDDVIANAEAKFYLSTGDEKKQVGFAQVGPSTVAFGYARSFQDGYLGDYFQRDRFYGQLGYLLGGVVLTRLEGGISRVGYPSFLLEGTAQESFSETRVDVLGFAEWRPRPTIGINLTLRYDQNASQVLQAVTYSDDLSFSRFQALLGARWFL